MMVGAGAPMMVGAARPQLMNLESNEAEAEILEADAMSLDIDLGTTEYVLISMWFAFTAGVFGLLYKITSEAD